MIETAHAQWKIAKIDKKAKQRRTAKMSTSYRKPMSLNPLPVTDLRWEVEWMHWLHSARSHYITIIFETRDLYRLRVRLNGVLFWNILVHNHMSECVSV